jgi:hypothetical protein
VDLVEEKMADAHAFEVEFAVLGRSAEVLKVYILYLHLVSMDCLIYS